MEFSNRINKTDAFAKVIMGKAVKWNDETWVMGQYDHHVEECAELRASGDPHLNAELIDKAIIASVLFRLKGRDKSADLLELKDMDGFDDLFELRKAKFMSKIHL